MTDLQITSGDADLTKRGTAKWGDAALAGFQVVPDILLMSQDRLGLSPTDPVVLLNICSYWWSKDQLPFPRSTTIAARMGLDPRSVQRSVRKLRKAGLLEQQRIERPDNKVVRALSLEGLVKTLDAYAQADPVLSSRIDRYKKFKNAHSPTPERMADAPT